MTRMSYYGESAAYTPTEGTIPWWEDSSGMYTLTVILSVVCALFMWCVSLLKLAPLSWLAVAKRNFGKWIVIWGLVRPSTFDELLVDVTLLSIAARVRMSVRVVCAQG